LQQALRQVDGLRELKGAEVAAVLEDQRLLRLCHRRRPRDGAAIGICAVDGDGRRASRELEQRRAEFRLLDGRRLGNGLAHGQWWRWWARGRAGAGGKRERGHQR
jgi:hypothetical protein